MGHVYVIQNGDNVFKVDRSRTGLNVFDVIETEFDKECEGFLHCKLVPRRSRTAKDQFELEPEELTEAIRQAREYVEKYLPRQQQAKELSKQESDGQVIRAGERELLIYHKLLDTNAHLKLLRLTKENLETELKLAMGRAPGIEGLIAWRTGPYRRFDSSAFRLSQPALYNQFVKETRVRTFRIL